MYFLEIPTHIWDDPKKKHCSWDGTNKGGTVEYLLGGGSKGISEIL